MQYRVSIKSIDELRNFFKNLPANCVALFITGPEDYRRVNLEILKTIIMLNKFSGIYITTGRPYDTIVKFMKEAGIDTSKVFFIDCVTKMYLAPKGIVLGKPGIEMSADCLYLTSPANLVELGIALSQAVSMVKDPKNKFIFVDSLSMLLVYNDISSVIKFVHFLVTRVKLFGLVGIIMVMEEAEKRGLLASMYELFDVIAEVKI